MKSKKILSMLIVSGLVVSSLAGCGGSSGKTTGGNTSETQKTAQSDKKGPMERHWHPNRLHHGQQFNVITFDTAQVGDSESGSFFLATCEGLFRENKGVIENAGCESMRFQMMVLPIHFI